MTKLSVPFFIRDAPQCPICRIQLEPHVVVIAHRIAFCQACVDSSDPALLHRVSVDRRDADGCLAYSTDRGISFYCPPPSHPGHAAAYIAHLILKEPAKSGKQGEMVVDGSDADGPHDALGPGEA